MSDSGTFRWILRHGDTDIFDLIHGLREGDPLMIGVVVLIVGMVAFFALHELVTGRPFVKSKKERRRAHERRHKVLWKYERDDS